MKLNSQTTRLITIITLIFLLLKTIAIGFRINIIIIPQYIAFIVSFTTEIGYVLIILYLLKLLSLQQARLTKTGLSIFLAGDILMFFADIVSAIVNFSPWTWIYITTAIGGVMVICNVFLIFTSLKIKPFQLSKPFRYFFITIIIVTFFRGMLPPLIVTLLGYRYDPKDFSYLAFLTLLPTLFIFLILKQATLLINDKKPGPINIS